MKELNKQITIEEIINKMKKNNKKADSKIVLKAYNFAVEKHGEQLRRSGEPYIIHPMQVANILAELGLDDSTVCAALLHDVVEDTEVTHEDLIREFSLEIAEMVDGVTKLSKLNCESVEETMDLYSPLANRIGIYSLKWELEDLAFKYLYPEDYREIVEGIDRKREERLNFIDKIEEEIKKELKAQKIDAEITGRAKHLYSIYRKMKRDNITIDQIYDLFALRIIVNSVKDCYAALGVVHDLYNPMPGRFKDYIAVPKPNMYQSLHTTLIGEKGTPFEVQIRTWDMHRIAEYGIAAHWAYKEASFSKGKKANVQVTEDKLAWLRETLEWQKDIADPQEFLNTLKTELFEDEVYVFTPKGDIKVLPNGSTPIDYAYSIHAEIGHHMTGCKINSKMMPIITKLRNGDIVEIVTSDKAKGPSRDWLKFIQSSTAKNKIQAWFKKNQREENIEKGKDLIEKEIKRIGMDYSELFKTEFVQGALNRYKFTTTEDMYAAVGFGAISSGKVIARILEEYRKDNCLVKLSKCCNPVPGDNIVGYITRGRGVSVHRADCKNLKDLFLDEQNRMIDVYWLSEKAAAYNVDIEIFANDRTGLLADIISQIGTTKTKLIAVASRANKERIAITEITLEVENLEELNNVLKVIRKVDSVYEVKRKK